MKKIFTLIAAAVVAVSASAQVISWAEGDATPDGAQFTADQFVITLANESGKLEVDANTAYFGTADSYKNYDYRLRSGGKSGTAEGKTNYLTLTIPTDGTVSIYARTGSNKATDRNVVLTQGETELLNQILLETDAVTAEIPEVGEKKIYPVYTVEVKAGEATITYPVGSINFYAIEFTSGATGIKTLDLTPALSTKKVVKNGKVVIETANGTFNASGAKQK